MKSKAIKRMLALFLALTMALGGAATVFAADSTSIASIERAADETELINLQSEWKYLDDNTDPAGEGERTSWTAVDFDDSSWKTSAGHNAKFGAKRGAIQDLGNNSIPEVLLNQYIEGGDTDIPAYFFRTSFELGSKSDELTLTGALKYDDAAIVYVNGTKVASFDELDGGFSSNLSYGGSNASDPKDVTFTVDSSVLREGVNVVAVELHQGRESSSDIYFEMSSLKLAKAVVEQSSIALTVGADEMQMNFTWYCSREGNGMVYLAKQSDLVGGEMPENAQVISASVTAANKSGYYSNQATAAGLERGTTYAYQLVNGDMKSEVKTFTTTDQQRAFSFGFVGDPQIGAGSRVTDTEGWGNTLGIMDGNALFEDIDFILSAGDQVNTASNEEEYDGFLEHSTLSGMPIATVVGNHDSSSNSYAQHFAIPNASTYGGTTAGSDYYFVYNNVLFLVLNSNNQSTTEHKAFMEAAIADTAGQDIAWKVVTFHHSIYSVASHAVDSSILQRRTELVPVFKELDIDVVLMGHDHVYCRTYMMDGLEPMTDAALYDDADYSSITNPTGILYVTANSGSGSKFYNIKNSLEFPYSRIMNQERVPNVSRVDVSDESFTITTYRTNDMSVVDTFTINRAHIHNAVAKEAVPATCTQEGTAAHWYCEECGKYFSDADCTKEIVALSELTVPAKGHTPGKAEVVEPTATKEGSKTVKCTVCGEILSTEIIPATGTDVDKPTTPAKPGNNTPATDKPTTPNTTKPANNNNKTPQTGDTNNATFWIVMMLTFSGVFAGTMIYTKRKKGYK